MDFPHDQIEELKQAFRGVQVCEEGGYTFFFIPDFILPVGCVPTKTNALLCPMPRDGYTSRLFFSERVKSGNSPNWNASVRILESNWQAYSWKIPQTELRLLQMIGAHLRGLR